MPVASLDVVIDVKKREMAKLKIDTEYEHTDTCMLSRANYVVCVCSADKQMIHVKD